MLIVTLVIMALFFYVLYLISRYKQENGQAISIKIMVNLIKKNNCPFLYNNLI